MELDRAQLELAWDSISLSSLDTHRRSILSMCNREYQPIVGENREYHQTKAGYLKEYIAIRKLLEILE